MKTMIMALALGLGLAGSGMADDNTAKSKAAKTKQMQQKMEKGDWKSYLVKELDLSKDQAEKIGEIKKKYDSVLSQLKKKKFELRKELWTMAKQPDKGAEFQKKLSAKHEEVQKARDAFDNKKFQMMLEAREVLKPDQIADLDHVMEHKWKYHKWRHKNRMKQSQESCH